MRTLLLTLIMACTACTTNAGAPSEPGQPVSAPAVAAGTPGAATDTLAQIRAMVGNAACSDNAQCRSLPLGARACGGPEAYLPYSIANLSEPSLLALAERYKAERQAGNAASGMMSNCRFIPDPGAVCRGGTCQPGTGEPQVR